MNKTITLIAAALLITSWGAVNAEVADGLDNSLGHSNAPTSQSGAPLPPNHPPTSGGKMDGMNNMGGIDMSAAKMMQPEGPVLQGNVMDVNNGAGYSYILIESAGNQFWIAGTQVTASKGDVVSYIENVTMENFHSKALNKTFDKIVFASSVNVVQ